MQKVNVIGIKYERECGIKMKTAERINELLGITDSYQAPQKVLELLYKEKSERDEILKEFLSEFDKRVDYDWFSDYYQEEHSMRKKHKQDFTPRPIIKILNQIAHNETGSYYEPGAGTGAILIDRWNQDRLQHTPFDYEPSMYFYTLEEISDRAIPFLLFNMVIRGMNGVVIQCDTLTREGKGVFFVQNDDNNFLGFSSINRMDYSESIEQEFDIKFVEQKYPEIKQTREFPEWLLNELDNKN